ncbi:hypothetical protein JCM13210_04400 [Thermaerobacter litoralis]
MLSSAPIVASIASTGRPPLGLPAVVCTSPAGSNDRPASRIREAARRCRGVVTARAGPP